MDSKEFKIVFRTVAKENGFQQAFGGWYKESSESITILELQKSNYGDYYILNIKTHIKGAFGKDYLPSKDLIKSSLGHINSNETDGYRNIFDFDKPLDDSLRIAKLKELFNNHIVPFTNKTTTRVGIKELESSGQIKLLPAIKEELEKLMK